MYILTELCADADQLQQLLEKEGVQGQHNEAANSYLQADTVAGQRNAIITDYIIRILGLDASPTVDVCSMRQLAEHCGSKLLLSLEVASCSSNVCASAAHFNGTLCVLACAVGGLEVLAQGGMGWSHMQQTPAELTSVLRTVLRCMQVCADIPVGSAMVRGISGGQKKRVTTGRSLNMLPEACPAACKCLCCSTDASGQQLSSIVAERHEQQWCRIGGVVLTQPYECVCRGDARRTTASPVHGRDQYR